jgi:16S rRNA (guanine1207-N2)-methyltransferase
MKQRRTLDTAGVPEAWLPVLHTRVHPPVAIALGSPRQVAELVEKLPLQDTVAYQMDLFQADRLRELLKERSLPAKLEAAPDLWDLPGPFQTVIYPVEPKGERILKLDILEQAFHLLRPHGTLLVLSRHENEQFFPPALKKIYGRVHAPDTGVPTLLWCQRNGERPRRRHEVTFQVSGGAGTSLRFLSRPGVFSYGRFDNGARALVETAVIRTGDAILDLGCGCGTNGVLASLRGGPTARVTFVDSNLRAVALAQANAAANGLAHFGATACAQLDGLAPGSFDVVLTNPPYFASLGIAQRFIEQSRPLLKRHGRFYLVTKQPEQVGPMVADHFGPTEAYERRGYIVLTATASR